MVKLASSRHRRGRGAPLGGPLQRQAKFCFAACDGEALTHVLAEWLRPELLYAGARPKAWQLIAHARALRAL